MVPDFKRPQPVDVDSIRIPEKEVLRRLGYPHDSLEQIDPGMRNIMEEAMQLARGLFKPKGICRFLRVASRADQEMAFRESPFRIHSRQVTRMLENSDPVVFFMATLGPDFDRAVETLLQEGEVTRAFVLDAIGSETADALADELHRNRLGAAADRMGYAVTPRFSPGYGDWTITVQPDLADLCGGRRIGISVTPSCLMVPKKSVSAVLGWNRKE